MAPGVRIIAHDASTKMHLGYAKIGKIKIRNNVFIGAGSVVLPNVTIGNDVVIGANSTVTHDIPDNSVAAGCPARVIQKTSDYLDRERERMKSAPVYDESYTVRGNITEEKKEQMKAEINSIAFIR